MRGVVTVRHPPKVRYIVVSEPPSPALNLASEKLLGVGDGGLNRPALVRFPPTSQAEPPINMRECRGFEGGEGCVAKFAAGCEWPRYRADQAATWNSSATKLA